MINAASDGLYLHLSCPADRGIFITFHRAARARYDAFRQFVCDLLALSWRMLQDEPQDQTSPHSLLEGPDAASEAKHSGPAFTKSPKTRREAQ